MGRKAFRWSFQGGTRGLRLDTTKPYWEVSGPKKFPQLFKTLPSLLPADAILYFEGGSPSGELKKFLESASMPEQVHVACGTIWPRPAVFHVPATHENMAQLSALTEHCAEPELAIHIHVYRDHEMLIEWHDAFSAPMLISSFFSEDEIALFCKSLEMSYNIRNGES